MYAVIIGFITIGSALVWYLLRHDHGRKLPVESLWLAFGFGLVGMMVAMFLETKLLPNRILLSSQGVPKLTLLTAFLGVGIIEEAAKFIPLAAYVYRKPYFVQHTDGVIYFAICGLTFGLGENILYTLAYGGKVGMGRLLLTPFFHAATTAIIGYYLVSYKISSSNRLRLVLAAVLVPFMHGLYDFGLSAGLPVLAVVSLMITLLLTLGLFLYFMQANDLDRLALDSLNVTTLFCTSCGHTFSPTAYCERCGHKLTGITT